MKWIVFQNIDSKLDLICYPNSILIAYILNFKVIGCGMDDLAYNFCEYGKIMKLESKIEFIIKDSLHNDPKNHQTFLELQHIVKDFGKTKNKSSKQIISFNLLKKKIESIHENVVARIYLKLEAMYNIPTLKALIDDKNFKIFDHTRLTTEKKYTKSEMVTEILQLKLPDLDSDYSLLFLSNFHRKHDFRNRFFKSSRHSCKR